MPTKVVTPRLQLLTRGSVRVAPANVVGSTLFGERRIVPILGGTFDGKLAGEVLPGGADWQVVTANGAMILEARYTIRTPKSSLIYVCNKGVRHSSPEVMARLARGEAVDASEYYCRTTPTFETGDPELSWLNTLIAVGSVVRTPDAVLVEFYEVL